MAEKFEVLNDREHTLRKSHIMVGGTTKEELSTYINGAYTTLNVTPGLLVITREIIDNSVDEFIRSNKKAATKINIAMNSLSLTVEDNGRGIPVERYTNSDGVDNWRPVLCWTQLRAGTSFTGHNVGPSSNGVGASVANILASFFSGTTCDGKNVCTVTCSDNMSDVKVNVSPCNSTPRGTRVYIEPDFERFDTDCYTPDHIIATKERISALASVYPEITFTFNGEKIKTRKPKEYVERFNKKYVMYEGENYYISIMPTELDEYYQLSYIDGLFIKNGGTHESYIAKELSYALRDIIKKKYKLDMSPGEIKRGLFILFNGRFFPNMKFDSQTKERLTNSESEVKSYLGNINFDKLAKDIINVPEIIEPIIEAKLAKQLAAEKRAVTLAQKKLQKIVVEKHTEAKSKNREETILFLSEGDSAVAQGKKLRDVNKHGFFPLRGFPLNTYGVSDAKILENQELKNIMAILNLKLHMSPDEVIQNLHYGKIGLFADSDVDGAGGIVPLLINFFSKWPVLFEKEKIYIITSPRYIFTKNKGKATEKRVYCYNKNEYDNVCDKYKDWELRYIKGLGSLRESEYRDVLNSPETWLKVELDDLKCLDIMFSKNVNERRKIMGM